jgi:histidine triad (HIT) family protein
MSEAGCKFCAVARGEDEATIVFGDGDVVAFLDHRPLFPGHCLLIPREHIETLDDLPAKRLGPFFATVQLLARAVEQGMKAEGTFVAVNNRVSQSVPHLHVHVVPRRRGDGLRGFFWPRQKYPDPAAERKAAAAIRAAIEAEMSRRK